MEGGGGLGGKVWLLLGGDDDEVAVSSGSGCVGIKTKKQGGHGNYNQNSNHKTKAFFNRSGIWD